MSTSFLCSTRAGISSTSSSTSIFRLKHCKDLNAWVRTTRHVTCLLQLVFAKCFVATNCARMGPICVINPFPPTNVKRKRLAMRNDISNDNNVIICNAYAFISLLSDTHLLFCFIFCSHTIMFYMVRLDIIIITWVQIQHNLPKRTDTDRQTRSDNFDSKSWTCAFEPKLEFEWTLE